MGNSRALQKATKELTKAKAPSKPRDIIYDPMGQWKHPGENTRIPSSNITMQGVPYPVYAQPNVGAPQMMYPEQEYSFPGADYVDEYPQMKRGGLKKSKYSKSIMAINKLFAKHDLFKKPGKHKIYDPNAKEYAEGGEQGCPEGYAFNPKTGECIEWNPDIQESYDQPTSFDPVGDVIYMNPDDRPEGMSDEEYGQMYNDQVEHEQLHRLQWKNDELKGESKTPLRMPSTVDNQEYEGDHYYNRRGEEEAYLHDMWNEANPDLRRFIPEDVVYNKEINPVMYELPWTEEGEARGYEEALHNGMESLFPKKQDGGEYGMPLGAGVSQNFIGNRDNFNVGGIPNLPLRDNRVNYNAFVNGFEPMTKKQDGGITDAMNAMMKARLAYANEFGNPAAQRMINLPDNPYQFDDGDTGTHYMASMDNYAVPQIQDENGQLMLGDYGPESNEAMRFDTDEDADYFAEHYKDVSPGFIEAELTDDEIQAYRDGGYVVEDISVPSLNQHQDGGTYTYSGRTDSKYKKDSKGNWLISNQSTGNKFVPIKDPTGSRSKELNRAARPEFDFQKISTPAESTDTHFLKQQSKQIGENRLMDFAQTVSRQNAIVDARIDEIKKTNYTMPGSGKKTKSKENKELQDKAINELQEQYRKNPAKTASNLEFLLSGRDKAKALKKGSIKSTHASVYDMLTNPFDAFKYAVSTGDVRNMPANYNKFKQAGIDPLEHRGGNLVGDVINTHNPLDIVDKVKYNTQTGNYIGAALHAARALPFLQSAKALPKVQKALTALDKTILDPIEAGLNATPFTKYTTNSSPLVKAIASNVSANNVLKTRAAALALSNSPKLYDATQKLVSRKDKSSLEDFSKQAFEFGLNLAPSTSRLGLYAGKIASAADEVRTPYFFGSAYWNLTRPKNNALIQTKDPLLGGRAFDYLSLIRNIPGIKAKGGEPDYVDTELTDAEIQDLIDEGYVVEQL